MIVARVSQGLIVIEWAWSNMGVVLCVMGLYNLLYLKNELINGADFLHAHTQSGKLKITLIIIGCIWSNMVQTFYVQGL